MVFSTNQNRQMYVATGRATSLSANSAAGTTVVKANTANTEMYLLYKGADGTNMRSDLIPVDKITYAKSTAANALKLKIKTVGVTLNGALKAGEDYILRINIAQAFGKADDHVYQKFGAVRATSSMTVPQFWQAMKESLVRNFSKEITKWFEFKTVTDTATAWVTATAYTVGTVLSYNNKLYKVKTAVTTSDTNFPTAKVDEITDGLFITEAEQPWVAGKTPKENVYFDVVNCYVKDASNVEVDAFTIAAPTYTLESKNGHVIVDQEIFYMGERGDQYRQVGWPYNIDVKYLASANTDYCAIDIHYSFVDSNEGVQKSEKDLYIVGEKATINSLISDINSVKANLLSAIA